MDYEQRSVLGEPGPLVAADARMFPALLPKRLLPLVPLAGMASQHAAAQAPAPPETSVQVNAARVVWWHLSSEQCGPMRHELWLCQRKSHRLHGASGFSQSGALAGVWCGVVGTKAVTHYFCKQRLLFVFR